MKPLALVVALGLAGASVALAQTTPGTGAPPTSGGNAAPYTSATPPPPKLNAAQSAEVQRQLGQYRTEVDARVARGEISPEDAGRLLQWREWQIAQQVAGLAPPPGPIIEEIPAPVVRGYDYRPYYAYPYYGPAYYPAPYWGGVSVCAGGWGHHVAGRFCF